MVLMINILSLDIRTRRPPLVLAVVAGVINSDIIEVLKAKLKAYNIYMYIQKQKLLHTMQSCTDLTHKQTILLFVCVSGDGFICPHIVTSLEIPTTILSNYILFIMLVINIHCILYIVPISIL